MESIPLSLLVSGDRGKGGDSRKEMAREIIYAKEGTQGAAKTIYKSSHAKFPLKCERSIRYD